MFAFVLLLFITTRFATQTPDNQTVIPLGQIVEKVVCAQDVNQTYALYLPSNYVSTRKWPILYAFDPGARGRIPVERFKEAAERFGWIIVGSNNSRNASIQSSTRFVECDHARHGRTILARRWPGLRGGFLGRCTRVDFCLRRNARIVSPE